MNLPDGPLTPREELEIRITALLMGQLPPEEASALETQIAADPELTALRTRLQHAVELLREARNLPKPHAAATAAPLQLSKERREKLLAAFRGIKALPSPALPPTPGVKVPAEILPKPPVLPWKRRERKWVPVALAASIAVLIGASLLFPTLSSSRKLVLAERGSNYKELYGNARQEKSSAEAVHASPPYAPEVETKQLSETAQNVFIGQIRAPQNEVASADPDSPQWVSQPGAIRTFGSGDDSISRLYRSDAMKADSAIASAAPSKGEYQRYPGHGAMGGTRASGGGGNAGVYLPPPPPTEPATEEVRVPGIVKEIRAPHIIAKTAAELGGRPSSDGEKAPMATSGDSLLASTDQLPDRSAAAVKEQIEGIHQNTLAGQQFTDGISQAIGRPSMAANNPPLNNTASRGLRSDDTAGALGESLSTQERDVSPLTQHVGKTTVIADPSSNSITIVGSPEVKQRVQKVLDQLDQPQTPGPGGKPSAEGEKAPMFGDEGRRFATVDESQFKTGKPKGDKKSGAITSGEEVSGLTHSGEEFANPNGWRNNTKGPIRLVPSSNRPEPEKAQADFIAANKLRGEISEAKNRAAEQPEDSLDVLSTASSTFNFRASVDAPKMNLNSTGDRAKPSGTPGKELAGVPGGLPGTMTGRIGSGKKGAAKAAADAARSPAANGKESAADLGIIPDFEASRLKSEVAKETADARSAAPANSPIADPAAAAGVTEGFAIPPASLSAPVTTTGTIALDAVPVIDAAKAGNGTLAISEPYSVAGRVNLNQPIKPFGYTGATTVNGGGIAVPGGVPAPTAAPASGPAAGGIPPNQGQIAAGGFMAGGATGVSPQVASAGLGFAEGGRAFGNQPLTYDVRSGQLATNSSIQPSKDEETIQKTLNAFSPAGAGADPKLQGIQNGQHGVQWMYQLQDGTVIPSGAVDGIVTNGTALPGAGAQPTLANPIVGRLAFWTDDDTSKLNINTNDFSEATYWSAPQNNLYGTPRLTPEDSKKFFITSASKSPELNLYGTPRQALFPENREGVADKWSTLADGDRFWEGKVDGEASLPQLKGLGDLSGRALTEPAGGEARVTLEAFLDPKDAPAFTTPAAPAKTAPAPADKEQKREAKLDDAIAIKDQIAPAATPPANEPPPAPKAEEPPPVPQPEVATKDNAFSTFSLNVSDVSYKLATASLEKGKMPAPGSVRSEEFLNAFNYRDPEPAPGAPLAFASERARDPFAYNRDLLRLSVKTAAAGRERGRPLNLVLLLDNSGSMERADRVRILKESLRVLTKQLQPQDKLSIITFSRTARLWADGVPATKAAEFTDRVGQITPEGGTNLSAAMDLGYETALKHYQVGSINRVVLMTDGAANLGDVKPEALKEKVESHRKQGVAFDCFGVGWEGYNDDLLEQLSRNGDGRYGFINTPEEAGKEFAGQLAGALQVAASDVKVQVEFNPRRVTTYRQIGYAKHQLKKEQFRDNTVDAAEIGAAESGNALYDLEVNPAGEGDLATVRVRFRVPGTEDYQEHEWTVPYGAPACALEQASSSLRLAASASAFAEWLAHSPFAAEVTPDRLLGLLNGLPAIYGADPRPAKLEWMLRQARSLNR